MENTLSDDKGYFAQCVEFRGYVLEYISALEYSLNEYIADFFCEENKSKAEAMQLLILGDDRMSLSAKAQVFYQIAKTYDKKWYDAYNPPDAASMNNDLVKAIEQRNIFAHRIADVNAFVKEGLPKGTIRFIKFKNSLEAIEYDKEKFKNLLDMILKLINHFYHREAIIALNIEPYDPNYDKRNS